MRFFQGAAIDRIVFEIMHRKDSELQFDFVMCLGHFLSKVLAFGNHCIVLKILLTLMLFAYSKVCILNEATSNLCLYRNCSTCLRVV